MKKMKNLPDKSRSGWGVLLLVICIVAYGFYLYFVKGERFDPPVPTPPPALTSPP